MEGAPLKEESGAGGVAGTKRAARWGRGQEAGGGPGPEAARVAQSGGGGGGPGRLCGLLSSRSLGRGRSRGAGRTGGEAKRRVQGEGARHKQPPAPRPSPCTAPGGGGVGAAPAAGPPSPSPAPNMRPGRLLAAPRVNHARRGGRRRRAAAGGRGAAHAHPSRGTPSGGGEASPALSWGGGRLWIGVGGALCAAPWARRLERGEPPPQRLQTWG